MKKNWSEMKNTMYELNTLEGISCRLNETEDQHSKLQNKIKISIETEHKKDFLKKWKSKKHPGQHQP